MFATGKNDAGEGDGVHRPDGFADYRIVVTDFTVRYDVVRSHHVKVVDFLARYELVDVNGAGGLQRDVIELVLADL
jgi:hypothetical protein